MAGRTLASDVLLARLAQGTASSSELERAVGRSQTWVNDTLRARMREGLVLRLGSRRGTRYGLRREIAGAGSEWPLHRIDGMGVPQLLGTVHALAGDEYFIESAPARCKIPAFSQGLPYFLQDQRPAGFLGRAVPLQFPQLEAPARVQDWSDAHYLRYLTRYGSDSVGDLILGRTAFDRYVAAELQPLHIAAAMRASEFPRLADEAMRGGLPGSSAHGEHPKFSIVVEHADSLCPVLVKFSPPVDRPAGERWSDLLIAEHVALETLRTAGVPAAVSCIHRAGNRTFLELERFDRTATGRVGVTSLHAISVCLLGRIEPWVAAGERLARAGYIEHDSLDTIRLASVFGDLIGNTDMHAGNLAFFDAYDGRFVLAPLYDMLPMLHAPEHEEIIEREFKPSPPSTDTLAVWGRVRVLAEGYWRSVSVDPRVSSAYRGIAAACLQTLHALPRTGSFAAMP